ncbi:TonB-dependent receptor [uncultured Desulfobacter sp.]|uniref:TonB-dependent receptor plug domain-containing protein n=1 Tax=uncultured Desulfobacter sp. TaxID=240139 RepID=UPI0029F55771|nr:TonB-dependent receptor [uncultured Desulfobacter sp.]
MFKIIARIIAVLIVCSAMNVLAEDTLDQTPAYDLGEVVVTASESQGVESVGTLHEITAQQIELRHATTLDKAIELLPGLDVRRGAQGIPRVNIRGMRSRHVVLLLNGIPFNSTYDGQFDPSIISTENIARIKVSYGNHSVLYGQGGLGGVINIITKKGTKGITGGLSADIDERGNMTAKGDISGGNDRVDYFVSTSRQDSDGFILSNSFDDTSEEDGGIRENSDYFRENIFTNLGVTANDSFRFGIVAGVSKGEFGQPPSTINDKSDPYAKSPKYDRVEDYEGHFAQLSIGYDPGGLFSLRAWGYLNENDEQLVRYDNDEYSAITKSNNYDKTDETDVTGATVQGFFNFDTLGQLGVSLNAETNSYDSNGLYGNGNPIAISHDLSLYAAAMEYEATFFDRLGVVAGYSHHWQNKDQGNDDDQGAWLTGVSYDLAENTRLRASYARKIRFASIKNLYDADAGNEDLETETSDNYEIGVTQLLPYGIMADFALFQNNVKDYIQKVEQPSGDDLYENFDEYRFKGIELFLSKQFSKAGASLGYSYMDAENKSEGAAFEDLEYRPVHKFTLEGNYAFDFGLIAYASLMYLTDQVYDGDSDQGDLGDITLVDLKIEQRVYKEICSVYLGVNNLFDEDYEESYGFPQAGRTTYAGMKIRF